MSCTRAERWFVALALPAALCVAGPVHPEVEQWSFRVYLDDRPIGQHIFQVQRAGDDLEVTTEARFDVKLLFITAYRYRHRATESWRGNCLSRLDALTDDNGTQVSVRAEQSGARFRVLSQQGPLLAEGCVMSYAYWNPAILRQSRLLNAQTGLYEPVTITLLGGEDLMVRGTSQRTLRYRITGAKHPIDVWYGPGNIWVALQSTLDG